LSDSPDDRWRRFIGDRNNSALKYRHLIEITLYGSYYPHQEKLKLLELREYLRKKGYAKTRLVGDHANPNSLDPVEMSKACLEYADVNFLVFTHAGMRHGVIRELDHCIDSPSMVDRRWRCVVFAEVLNGKSALPDLNVVDVERLCEARIRRIDFDSLDSLKAYAEGVALRYLFDLGRFLKERERAQAEGTSP
jgi:hypothetical protein